MIIHNSQKHKDVNHDGVDCVQILVVDGVLEIKDQLKNYVDCGPALANFSLLEFFLNTYKTDTPGSIESENLHGHHTKERIPYLEGTAHNKKYRVVRGEGHESMPNFVGDWFSENDVKELQDIYHASILALLMPWTDICMLKRNNEKFKDTFNRFVSHTNDHTRNIIQNIQYQYICADSAKIKRQERAREKAIQFDDDNEYTSRSNLDNMIPTEQQNILNDTQYSQRDVDNQITCQFLSEDKLFAEVALNIAMDHGIFAEDTQDTQTQWAKFSHTAMGEEMPEFTKLEKMVAAVTKGKPVPDNSTEICPTGNASDMDSEDDSYSTISNARSKATGPLYLLAEDQHHVVLQ